MRLVAGIDVGAGTTKAVVMDEEGRVAGQAIQRTVPPLEQVAERVLGAACRQAGTDASGVPYVATTGLGRYAVPFRTLNITDITCAARTVARRLPGVRFVLDIGAQSTRAIRMREDGRVERFQCSEKCAAGSGSFVERVARYVEVPLTELGELALQARQPQPISSICAVLAESEIINHLSEGKALPDIVYGVYVSLAQRAHAQLRRLGLDGPVALLGGLALQPGFVRACRETWDQPVSVLDEPQMAAAYGAALLGWRRYRVWQREQATVRATVAEHEPPPGAEPSTREAAP